MKSLLPPISHSKLSRSITRYTRRLSSLFLTFAGLFLAALSVLAMNHAPIVSWIADQRVTGSTPSFQTQFFRVTNFDPATVTLSKTATMTPANWISMSAISLTKCNGEAGCASDGTGWKVTFNSTPTAAGRATITVKATNTSTNLVGYTSFTLQVDPAAGANPPSLATLPNYALQQTYYDQTTHSYYAIYTAQFAIGDLGSSGNYVNKEDVEVIYSNYTGDFIETWNNASLIDFITLTPVALSSDPDIARRETTTVIS